MSELKISDFDEMLTTSTSIANQLDITSDTLKVQLEDEEGDIYDIVDVKFNMVTRSIHITFNHDNDE